MFTKQEDSIFELRIDEAAKAYMMESARWAKFLAIIGYVMLVLLVLASLVFMLNIANVTSQFGAAYGITYGIAIVISYLFILVPFFIINLTMYRYAVRVRMSLQSNNQQLFVSAFMNLKNMFKVWGIFTIVFMLIYGIAVIGAIISTSRAIS